MILPRINPVVPDIKEVPANHLLSVLNLSIVLVITALAAFVLARFAAGKYSGNKKKTILAFVGIGVGAAVLLLCFFGLTAVTVKGIIFTLILILSSYSDIRTRECDDCLSVMTLVAAFIGTELSALPGMFVTGLIVMGIMLGAAVFCKSGIGGADIKLSAACTFLLGFERGITGLCIGLLAAIIVNLVRHKGKSKSFPLIPYLAAGFLAAYFM